MNYQCMKINTSWTKAIAIKTCKLLVLQVKLHSLRWFNDQIPILSHQKQLQVYKCICNKPKKVQEWLDLQIFKIQFKTFKKLNISSQEIRATLLGKVHMKDSKFLILLIWECQYKIHSILQDWSLNKTLTNSFCPISVEWLL